jgi:hypothetical protein
LHALTSSGPVTTRPVDVVCNAWGVRGARVDFAAALPGACFREGRDPAAEGGAAVAGAGAG